MPSTNNQQPIASTSSPILQAAELTKNFGYRRILKGVSFDLPTGSMTLLLGKNGAGKSTLMKIISGLSRPTTGTVSFQGEDIVKSPEKLRRNLGTISHAMHFYGELTALENLCFFAKLYNVAEAESKAEKALVATGLASYSDLPVKTYSSGMGKRLNIARLMVNAPKLLLLDEPYTGLDYDSIEFFNRFLANFKEQGGTIFMISHQIEACFGISDSVMILEQGVIRLHSQTNQFSYHELIEEYQNQKS